MDIQLIEKSTTVHDDVQRAYQLNAEGNSRECLNILMRLYEQ